MVTKSKRAVRTVFYVPLTTPEGLNFLKLARRYLNKPAFKLRAVGRNEDRKGAAQGSAGLHTRFRLKLPLRHASYCALYLDSKNEVLIKPERLRWYVDAIDQARNLVCQHLTGRYSSLDDALQNLLQAYVATRDHSHDLENQARGWQTLHAAAKREADKLASRVIGLQARVTDPPTWGRLWRDFSALLWKVVRP